MKHALILFMLAVAALAADKTITTIIKEPALQDVNVSLAFAPHATDAAKGAAWTITVSHAAAGSKTYRADGKELTAAQWQAVRTALAPFLTQFKTDSGF